MSDKRLKFGDKEISKINLYNNTQPSEIDNIDVNKIKVSQKNYITKKIIHINISSSVMIMMSLDLYL